MKVLINERLSKHKMKTDEGYLICTDAVLARTGKQQYRKADIWATCEDADSVIDIDRRPEDVFKDSTIASFENKPITIEHPDVDVNTNNYHDYAVGFVRDVRKGKDADMDVIVGDLVFTDQRAIDLIESGEMTELSCGYNCDIVGDSDPHQINIKGNHVALCKQGRAGNARIIDNAIDDSMHDDEYELEELELPSNTMAGMYNGIFYKYVGNDIYYYKDGEFIRKTDLDKLLKMYPPKKRQKGKGPIQMFISQYIARDSVHDGHFATGDVRERLRAYLNWEGIYGYDIDNLIRLARKGKSYLADFLEEEGIFGYDTPIYQIVVQNQKPWIDDSLTKDSYIDLDFDGTDAEAFRLARKYGCSVRSVTSMNSDNGYPVYRFGSSDKKKLQKLAEEYGMDKEDFNYFVKDSKVKDSYVDEVIKEVTDGQHVRVHKLSATSYEIIDTINNEVMVLRIAGNRLIFEKPNGQKITEYKDLSEYRSMYDSVKDVYSAELERMLDLTDKKYGITLEHAIEDLKRYDNDTLLDNDRAIAQLMDRFGLSKRDVIRVLNYKFDGKVTDSHLNDIASINAAKIQSYLSTLGLPAEVKSTSEGLCIKAKDREGLVTGGSTCDSAVVLVKKHPKERINTTINIKQFAKDFIKDSSLVKIPADLVKKTGQLLKAAGFNPIFKGYTLFGAAEFKIESEKDGFDRIDTFDLRQYSKNLDAVTDFLRKKGAPATYNIAIAVDGHISGYFHVDKLYVEDSVKDFKIEEAKAAVDELHDSVKDNIVAKTSTGEKFKILKVPGDGFVYMTSCFDSRIVKTYEDDFKSKYKAEDSLHRHKHN